LQPAISFCEDGFPVSLHLATGMASLPRAQDDALKAAFLNAKGAPYQTGETFRQPELAESFRAIASDGRNGFYAGRVGKAIAEAMAKAGGLIGLDDLSEPTARWQEPLVSSYRGCNVFEQALPSQGLILLIALNVVERFPIADWGLTSPDSVHVMVEATRLAFADVRRHAADPDFEPVPTEWLLSEEHGGELAATIDLKRATAGAGVPIASDTTSFVVADEKMAVCYIQSVFSPWGSQFVIPGTGILMNNRMTGFHLDPASPNRLVPKKRTVHTLNNFLVVRDGRLVIGGGTPGADFQVQTNLQVIAGVVDWGLDLQAAVDSPRWATSGGGRLSVESRAPAAVVESLRQRGHDVQPAGPWGVRACSQLVSSLDGGGWAVASDLRGEGLPLGF
jgi:gamma-glutamyltranspeptidase/glutathione hydrolase